MYYLYLLFFYLLTTIPPRPFNLTWLIDSTVNLKLLLKLAHLLSIEPFRPLDRTDHLILNWFDLNSSWNSSHTSSRSISWYYEIIWCYDFGLNLSIKQVNIETINYAKNQVIRRWHTCFTQKHAHTFSHSRNAYENRMGFIVLNQIA